MDLSCIPGNDSVSREVIHNTQNINTHVSKYISTVHINLEQLIPLPGNGPFKEDWQGLSNTGTGNASSSGKTVSFKVLDNVKAIESNDIEDILFIPHCVPARMSEV